MIGKTISHYKILKKLGACRMNVAHKAQDLRLANLKQKNKLNQE